MADLGEPNYPCGKPIMEAQSECGNVKRRIDPYHPPQSARFHHCGKRFSALEVVRLRQGSWDRFGRAACH